MEAARSLNAPHLPEAEPPTVPVLPQAPARPAPSFERRQVEVELVVPRDDRHTSVRAYVLGAIGLAAVSVGGWFALSEYIYG